MDNSIGDMMMELAESACSDRVPGVLAGRSLMQGEFEVVFQETERGRLALQGPRTNYV
jgi:hypothetical protein